MRRCSLFNCNRRFINIYDDVDDDDDDNDDDEDDNGLDCP